MVINVNKGTAEKYAKLKSMIVDEKDRPISDKRLFEIMVDIFYENLVKGDDDK